MNIDMSLDDMMKSRRVTDNETSNNASEPAVFADNGGKGKVGG
ncbi:hypothetical protein TrRE_jg5914, partial [Triparma retinervis]